MLELREADLPVLFLVLVVFPVVAYVLLGKWGEISKKRGRVNLLAQMAAEEALRAHTTAAATVVPVVVPVASPSKNNGLHVCAMCFTPATTRCSRCKSIRYCSGKCQIIHWRQIHKDECVPAEISSYVSSPEALKEKVTSDNGARTSISSLDFSSLDCSLGDRTSQIPTVERRKKSSCISNMEASRKIHAFQSTEETSKSEASCSGYTDNNKPSKEAGHRHKSRHSNSSTCETVSAANSSILTNKQTSPRSRMHGSYKHQGQHETTVEPRSSNIQHSVKVAEARTTRLPKSIASKSGEQLCSHTDRKEQLADESRFLMTRDTPPNEESNGVASMKLMKKLGLRKSTELTRDDAFEKYGDSRKRMLFPYEEFVKFFQSEVFDLYPRGLVNCGNSCYANAVLQCLTCTKPLVVYLLRRSHSRLSCRKDWCLMCELEQHVTTLRETGGPLSPSRILSHMQSINCRIGGGSQEDAHEFLRVLIASMQSICLDGLGGESKVNPRLQETTFVQHTFGGRLRSKVKCLRCHHESERYENIMDLTLEINGWVESLEDALTQFTTPEDLDGENMYRCGRCAEYVWARKQLRVHEAPNILTIVLKRFQEGRYGKINKCITFPDMLDMTPFMTGTADIPPLYMLYAVVVHLDVLNASFSGHYVSYVKDLHGNWLKIDDTEVCPMPLSQVMSEGAYILFYMRSRPRPQRASHNNRTQKQQVPSTINHCQSRNQKPSFQEQSKTANHLVGTHSNHFKPRIPTGLDNHSAYSGSISSDWSLFTSSDESSFTTESTRNSFSTVDYSEACNSDPFSIFNGLYNAEPSCQNTVACRMFSGTKPQTWFVAAEKGYVLDSEDNQGMYVNYGTNPGFSMDEDTYS